MQTKRIEKQLHKMSEVLLPGDDETQPTLLSLEVILAAMVLAETLWKAAGQARLGAMIIVPLIMNEPPRLKLSKWAR